jgi:hypothetical protein
MATPIGGSGPDRARFVQRSRKAREAEQKKAAEDAKRSEPGDVASAPARPLDARPAQDGYQAAPSPVPKAPAALSAGPVASERSFKAGLSRSRAQARETPAAPAPPSPVDDPRVAAQAVQELRNGLQAEVQKLAQNPAKLGGILRQVYGAALAPKRSAELIEQARRGQFPLPANVRFLDDAALQGRNAAYSPEHGGTVYLNKELVGDPRRLQEAFNEECGQDLGRALGGADSRGTEGRALGAALARGDVLGPKELALARGGGEPGTIAVDGRPVAVEIQRMSARARAAVARAAGPLGGPTASEADAETAAEALRTLEGKDLRDALGALRETGGLRRMLEALPWEARADFFQAVGKSRDQRAQHLVAGAVAEEEAHLLDGLKVWDAQTQTAVDKLRGLGPPMLGVTLQELQASGHLGRLFEEMPYTTRASFMRLVQGSRSAEAQEAVVRGVTGHIGGLMSGAPAEGDTKAAAAILKDLGPDLLGPALEGLRDRGVLAPLLQQMPAATRADFLQAVRDSGGAQAQAALAQILA